MFCHMTRVFDPHQLDPYRWSRDDMYEPHGFWQNALKELQSQPKNDNYNGVLIGMSTTIDIINWCDI